MTRGWVPATIPPGAGGLLGYWSRWRIGLLIPRGNRSRKASALASNLDMQGPGTSAAAGHIHVPRTSGKCVKTGFAPASTFRIDAAHAKTPDVARYPERLSQEIFYSVAYPLMVLSRRL